MSANETITTQREIAGKLRSSAQEPFHSSAAAREAKSALRARVRQQLAGLSSEHRARASAQACQTLQKQEIWRGASAILFYAPMRDELDISCLVDSALQAGKVAALPRYCPEIRAYGAGWITTPLSEVPVGKFGIREPATSCSIAPLNQLDLVLVPGLAFDGRGARLGHGRGFYDRLLAEVQGIKCGVGFDEQFISDVPVEAHDILLDVMLTPTRWLAFGPARAT